MDPAYLLGPGPGYAPTVASAAETHIRTGDSSSDGVRSRRNHTGFTLVELVIVITILGILAGVVLFALSGTTTTAAQAACKADAKSVETALESYKSQNGAYPTPGTGDPSTVGGAITYYAPLTSTTAGGPWLRSAPNPQRYEIWYNVAGQVFVTAPGVSGSQTDNYNPLAPNPGTNDFDFSNPNVCTTSIVH